MGLDFFDGIFKAGFACYFILEQLHDSIEHLIPHVTFLFVALYLSDLNQQLEQFAVHQTTHLNCVLDSLFLDPMLTLQNNQDQRLY